MEHSDYYSTSSRCFCTAGAGADVGADDDADVGVGASDDDGENDGAGSSSVVPPEGEIPSRGGSLCRSPSSAGISIFMSRAAVQSRTSWSISSLKTYLSSRVCSVKFNDDGG